MSLSVFFEDSSHSTSFYTTRMKMSPSCNLRSKSPALYMDLYLLCKLIFLSKISKREQFLKGDTVIRLEIQHSMKGIITTELC